MVNCPYAPLCTVHGSYIASHLRDLEKKRRFLIVRGGRKLNDPFDLYGWLSALTLREVQFTDRILHLNRETLKNYLV